MLGLNCMAEVIAPATPPVNIEAMLMMFWALSRFACSSARIPLICSISASITAFTLSTSSEAAKTFSVISCRTASDSRVTCEPSAGAPPDTRSSRLSSGVTPISSATCAASGDSRNTWPLVVAISCCVFVVCVCAAVGQVDEIRSVARHKHLTDANLTIFSVPGIK